MTTQTDEKLIFNEEETSIIGEPLSQYLENRKSIKLIAPSSACWRGYNGKWQIKDNKLYLIELQAYIEGYKEVGINYLFPGQNEVFAFWFSGEILIPKGEKLDYEEMKYRTLYEKYLVLDFENGFLLNEYLASFEENKNRLINTKKTSQLKTEVISSIFLGVIITVLLLIGTSVSVYNLIKLNTKLAYIFSAIIVFPLLLTIGGVIFLSYYKKKQKEDKAINFVVINLLAFIFLSSCLNVYYLIKYGTILAYFTSAIIISTLVYFIFIAIKNRINEK